MRALFACLACVFATIACGGSPRTGSTDGGVPAGDGPAIDGGGGAIDSGNPVPAGVLRTSFVTADSYSSGGVEQTIVIAGFYDQEPEPLSVTEETVGPCTVDTVVFLEGGAFPRYADLGAITVTGGAHDVTLAFGAGGYAPFNEPSALWAGGETLTFAASGAEVGAFEATVTAPAHVTMTAPTLPIGSDLVVDRAADLVLAWTGTSPGDVVVRLDGPQELPMPQVSIACAFPAADGAGTIPAAALSRIEPVGRGTIGAEVVSRTTASVPDWGAVEIAATASVLGRGRWGTSVELR